MQGEGPIHLIHHQSFSPEVHHVTILLALLLGIIMHVFNKCILSSYYVPGDKVAKRDKKKSGLHQRVYLLM